MTEKACPIGLQDCTIRGGNSCLNIYSCSAWALPWSLPLTRVNHGNSPFDPLTFDSPYWLVEFHSLYPPVRSEEESFMRRDWKKYFADHGYAQAEPLYIRNPKNFAGTRTTNLNFGS